MLYKNKKTNEISFPLGGIGTGSIGLAGNGRLMDWEIFNRPDKGSVNGYSHFAVKCRTQDGKTTVKVLNGDLPGSFMGQFSKAEYSGYGYGPHGETMCGFPHFKTCTFDGAFPIAELSFSDADFPAEVTLTAFNPFIPLDAKNSSLPAAFFEIAFTNLSGMEAEYTAAFSVCNPFGVSKNVPLDSGVMLLHETDLDSAAYGDLTVLCGSEKTEVQPYWYRGIWRDGITTFWREFCSEKPLLYRTYEKAGERDTCTVAGSVVLHPGETKKIRFVLAWNVPNCYNYWEPCKDEQGKDVIWKNYYATVFENSTVTAEYALKNWDSLYCRTKQFQQALQETTVDEAVIDRATANLSVLKSPTVLRLEDGSFYGWEGVHEKTGSCEGTCQHVWNYAYALCFLFPELEQSIRTLELQYATYENGQTEFRLKLPPGREQKRGFACLDGQMGTVMKIYRDFKISGDSMWLKQNWETIKKILEYAWSEENPHAWDLDKDGVLEGRQHHTLDMELFGPSSWLEGFYLGALKAASELAAVVGDTEKQAEYAALFEKGAAWTKENLFNGKYFMQKVKLTDKSVTERFDCPNYWNSEAGELKYQIGEGSAIDQLCAQWHADIMGLGDIFDAQQVQSALRFMFAHNFKPSMREHTNRWRVYALNGESGAVICDYPEGAQVPAIPIPYADEAMTGFEYAFAGLLISRGLIEEGLEIVRALHRRFDGEKRNPWNEFECGSNYARSMASFALIPIFGGFTFDLPHGRIGFNPLVSRDNFKMFWSLGTGWGSFSKTKETCILSVTEGHLLLKQLELPFAEAVSSVKIEDMEVPFRFEKGIISFEETDVRHGIQVKYHEK